MSVLKFLAAICVAIVAIPVSVAVAIVAFPAILLAAAGSYVFHEITGVELIAPETLRKCFSDD